VAAGPVLLINSIQRTYRIRPAKNNHTPQFKRRKEEMKTRMWPMPNVMVALPNIGGALCSTPQIWADAHY